MGDFLNTYLRDQLAMGIVWRELARRTQRSNSDTELGDVLHGVSKSIAEDLRTLQDIMHHLKVKPNPIKNRAAILVERAGRLKVNGRFTGYSPLSRFVELEMLIVGIDRKKQLWLTLRDLAGLSDRIPETDFDRLIQRADAQRISLEPYRAQAGITALRAS